MRRTLSMTSPAGYHALQHAHDDLVEGKADDQDRATSAIAGRELSNKPNAARVPRIDCVPQESVPLSPVSPLSEHGDALSRPGSLENESQAPSVEVVEQKPEKPATKRPGWWSTLTSDSWIIEVVAGIVSFAAVASIIGVLWGYDQEPVPPLWKGITVSPSLPACMRIIGD